MMNKSIYRSAILMVAGLICLSEAFSQVDTLYSSDHKISEIGTFVDGFKHGHWKSYYPDGTLEAEGKFRHGLRTGVWTWYHDNGVMSSLEEWQGGRYISGEYWDSSGNPSDVYEVLTHAEYPGGIEKFKRMISKSIIYPEDILEEGIEGRVILEFQINHRGELVNPVVTEQVHPALDEEALRVLNLSNLWIPAKFHGESIAIQLTMPIYFALE
jgi:TonB family protein